MKWVRIQSGWARTEKTPGVYEFDWLDDVIDNLLKRGLLPWICLCYGNGIYGEDAGKVFGAVGVPPIKNDTQKKAWADYVKAVAARYRGKVRHYEVWNEPDGIWCWKHGVNMTEYGNFIIDTAKAVRESDPDAYIIGGALCWPSIANLSEMLATGAAEHMNGFSFHEYTPDEAHLFEKTAYIRAVCA